MAGWVWAQEATEGGEVNQIDELAKDLGTSIWYNLPSHHVITRAGVVAAVKKVLNMPVETTTSIRDMVLQAPAEHKMRIFKSDGSKA